jgi:stringent starvation protein B
MSLEGVKMTASSTRPYMIRAIYEWCNDNGFTPFIAVSVDERTVVPREHVRAGEIVLNLSVSATNNLTLGNDLVHFHARFSGVVRELSIPVENITAIYARENGHGMAFEVPKPLAEVFSEPTSADGLESAPSPLRSPSPSLASKSDPRVSPILGRSPSGIAATKPGARTVSGPVSDPVSGPNSGSVSSPPPGPGASPTPGSVQKTASISSLPAPRPKSVPKRVTEINPELTVTAKLTVPTKEKASIVPAADTNSVSTEDDTPDPNNEPSGQGQRTGGRNGSRGRAKLTRIK